MSPGAKSLITVEKMDDMKLASTNYEQNGLSKSVDVDITEVFTMDSKVDNGHQINV